MIPDSTYDTWIKESLLYVVWKALKDTSENGLPLDHHFFLTFQTDREDVKMPLFLRNKYPKEMTIILQHQFENLFVSGSPYDGHFEVSLSFDGQMEFISVPFSALIEFSDPPANFGLHFTPKPPFKEKTHEDAIKTSDKVVAVDFRKKK